LWAQRKMKCAVYRSILTTPRTNCRGIPRASRWRKPMGVVLKGGTELPPVGSTLEGEAAAEPPNLEGEAAAEPLNVGGRGSCRAAKRGRARLLPSRGSQRPDRCFGSAGASPSRRGGQTGVLAQRELRPPEGAARQPFGSAGASPSRRGDTRGKPICSCAQDFALIRIVWGRVGARRPQTSGPLCEFDCVPLLSIARGWPCEQGHMLMVRG
jgi:hypothetical protein